MNTYLRIFFSSFPVKKSQYSYSKKLWLTRGIRISCANKRKLYLTYRNSNDPYFKEYYKKYCRIVVPVPKTGKDPTSIASYKPISLTSTMGKSMEQIINTRLNWLLETNNVIANEQAGFRIHRSTSEHIAKLSQFIKDALDNKRILTYLLTYSMVQSPS